MKTLSRTLALSLLAASLTAGAGYAQDSMKKMGAMKSDPMASDCMKKAKMEHDAMKMAQMEKACGTKASMKGGAMKQDTMAPKKN
jgi:pentapeptide MXKDX repeat protein